MLQVRMVFLVFLQVRMRPVFVALLLRALLLPVRTVFPVRQRPLGMEQQPVQLQERLVKQAFVVWLLLAQQFLLVRMVFLVFLQVRMRPVFVALPLRVLWLLLVRMVFPVRRLLLGMERQLVQLQERLVKQAFVVWRLWVQQFLLDRTVFPVRQRPLVTVRPKLRPAAVLARFAA